MSANGAGNQSAKRNRVSQIYPVKILRPGKKGLLCLIRIVTPLEQSIRFWQQEKEQSKLFTREAFLPETYRKYAAVEKIIDSFMSTEDTLKNPGVLTEIS